MKQNYTASITPTKRLPLPMAGKSNFSAGRLVYPSISPAFWVTVVFSGPNSR
jgi:hypothetical protein